MSKYKIQEKEYYYFAYGSNLNKSQMKQRCPDSIPVCKGTLYNARMTFKLHADIEKVKRGKNSVPGAVYRVSKQDIKELDRYEGYPIYYKKVKCRVIADSGKVIKCFMYIMVPNVREYQLPTERYFNIIADGYDDWNIPKYHLFNAWEKTSQILFGIQK